MGKILVLVLVDIVLVVMGKLSSSHRSAEPAELITNYCFDRQIKTYGWPKNLRNLIVHIIIMLAEKWIMTVTV